LKIPKSNTAEVEHSFGVQDISCQGQGCEGGEHVTAMSLFSWVQTLVGPFGAHISKGQTKRLYNVSYQKRPQVKVLLTLAKPFGSQPQ
jgi:hypothetical protein